MKPVRAHVIGSLLRPEFLVQARDRHAAGTLTDSKFKAMEDDAVNTAIDLQDASGIDVVNDGEMRRWAFMDHLVSTIQGAADAGGPVVSERGNGSSGAYDMQAPIFVVERIQAARMLSVEEYCYARARTRRPVKITMPSPLMLYNVWSPEHSRAVYPDPFDLFIEWADLLRREIRELSRLGCRYIQIDAPDLGILVDPAHQAARDQLGISTERTLTDGVDLINSLADVPGPSFALHLCRGNYKSMWTATGGYDDIAKRVFGRATNFDTFMLEYDDDRSGSFDPLREISDDAGVVLGLISTKTTELEPMDLLTRRVHEAARHVGLDRLGVSTQCGFASISTGANLISPEIQAAKLRRVGELADTVWGDGP